MEDKSIEEVIYLQRKDGLYQQIHGNKVEKAVDGSRRVALGKVTGLFRQIVIPLAPPAGEDTTEWKAALKRTDSDDVVMFMQSGKFVFAEPVLDVSFGDVAEGVAEAIAKGKR